MCAVMMRTAWPDGVYKTEQTNEMPIGFCSALNYILKNKLKYPWTLRKNENE